MSVMSNGSSRASLTEQAKSLLSVDFILVRAGIEHDTIYLYIIASCFFVNYSSHSSSGCKAWRLDESLFTASCALACAGVSGGGGA